MQPPHSSYGITKLELLNVFSGQVCCLVQFATKGIILSFDPLPEEKLFWNNSSITHSNITRKIKNWFKDENSRIKQIYDVW
jgi:hypothetical protein